MLLSGILYNSVKSFICELFKQCLCSAVCVSVRVSVTVALTWVQDDFPVWPHEAVVLSFIQKPWHCLLSTEVNRGHWLPDKSDHFKFYSRPVLTIIPDHMLCQYTQCCHLSLSSGKSKMEHSHPWHTKMFLFQLIFKTTVTRECRAGKKTNVRHLL